MLEQLEGTDLRAQAGNGVVWKTADNAFETRRAIEMGRRVAREVTTGTPLAIGERRATSAVRGFVTTVRQRDRDGLPGARPSARVSRNGRYVAFASAAPLDERDRNGLTDVYVVDLASGQVTLESIGPHSQPADGWSTNPVISGDGSLIAFESVAGNLTDEPFRSAVSHIYLRNWQEGRTRLLTAGALGHPANGSSGSAAISADGSAVAFESAATDLLPLGRGGQEAGGLYLIRLDSGQLARVDVRAQGVCARYAYQRHNPNHGEMRGRFSRGRQLPSVDQC